MRKKWGLIQELTKVYTFHSPIRKGKYRSAAWATNQAQEIPDEILVKTSDGRKLLVNPAPNNYQTVYFLGEYEKAITDVISKIVKKDDVCLDIGANIGWYSTLFQKLVGAKGAVHAFEPVPQTFSLLEKNVEMNSEFENIFINNFALGDVEKDIEMHIFKDLPSSHASLATFENQSFEAVSSKMKTLDSYLAANQLDNVNFIKADIEGAELFMLKGALRLFEQKIPPIWIIEMALGTTQGFDYLPNDLIEFIAGQSEYEFYEIDETNFVLKKISGFQKEEIGANVLCVPKEFYRERLAAFEIVN